MLVPSSLNDCVGQADRAEGLNHITEPSVAFPAPIVPVLPLTVTVMVVPTAVTDVLVMLVTLFAAALMVSATLVKVYEQL